MIIRPMSLVVILLKLKSSDSYEHIPTPKVSKTGPKCGKLTVTKKNDTVHLTEVNDYGTVWDFRFKQNKVCLPLA